jgi:hypothetical protein
LKDVFKILVSYLACSQIWLNLPVDHYCHFGTSFEQSSEMEIAQNCQKNNKNKTLPQPVMFIVNWLLLSQQLADDSSSFMS